MAVAFFSMSLQEAASLAILAIEHDTAGRVREAITYYRRAVNSMNATVLCMPVNQTRIQIQQKASEYTNRVATLESILTHTEKENEAIAQVLKSVSSEPDPSDSELTVHEHQGFA